VSLPKIGMDARMWGHPGIGRYIRELSSHLLREPFEGEFIFLADPQFKEKGLEGVRANGAAVSYRRAKSGIYSLNEQFEIPRLARDLDLLHVPHFNAPVFFKGKMVVTIHDLIYFHNLGASKSRFARAYLSFLLKSIQKKAGAVITVSEYTKKDLLKNFPSFRPELVFVTYEAASPIFTKLEDKERLERVRQKRALKKPFVLFVGSLKAHKNIPTLIKALDYLRAKKGLEHELVLVGRGDSAHHNKELVDLMFGHAFVRYLGELEDEELVSLYNLADLFVLPSFWEGFGLPVLEAMACGTPVASSDRTSLPEIVGDAGRLFNPDRVDALIDVLYNILANNELRKKMSSMGIERAKLFSWQRLAAQTLGIYRKALG